MVQGSGQTITEYLQGNGEGSMSEKTRKILGIMGITLAVYLGMRYLLPAVAPFFCGVSSGTLDLSAGGQAGEEASGK